NFGRILTGSGQLESVVLLDLIRERETAPAFSGVPHGHYGLNGFIARKPQGKGRECKGVSSVHDPDIVRQGALRVKLTLFSEFHRDDFSNTVRRILRPVDDRSRNATE